MSEAKKEPPAKYALLVDMTMFDALKAMSIRPRVKADQSRIFYHSQFNYMPVFRVPSYLLSGSCESRPPSIIDDFDRWFRAALVRVEARKFDERERQMRQLESVWRT